MSRADPVSRWGGNDFDLVVGSSACGPLIHLEAPCRGWHSDRKLGGGASCSFSSVVMVVALIGYRSQYSSSSDGPRNACRAISLLPCRTHALRLKHWFEAMTVRPRGRFSPHLAGHQTGPATPESILRSRRIGSRDRSLCSAAPPLHRRADSRRTRTVVTTRSQIGRL